MNKLNNNTAKYLETLKDFSDEKNFDDCTDLSHDEIIKKYGDNPLPIGEISKDDPIFKNVWKDVSDNKGYTGKGSFVDHWVNHHPEMKSDDFLKITDVLKNPTKRFIDEHLNAVIFVKAENSLNDIVFLKKDKNKLIFERSNYFVNKFPKRWIELDKKNGLKKISLVDGHPTISQSEKSEAGIVRNISTLSDNLNIPQHPEKSTIQSVRLSNENGTAQLFNKVVKLTAKNIELENKVQELTKQLEKAKQQKQKQKSKDDDFGRS